MSDPLQVPVGEGEVVEAHKTWRSNLPTLAGTNAILLAFLYLAEHGGRCVGWITARGAMPTADARAKKKESRSFFFRTFF
jgi:hypothetical protein